MFDITPGIPEDRLIKVLKEIAHFHSTTYHYIQEYPGAAEGLQKEYPDIFLTSFFDMCGDDENMKKMMTESQSSFGKSAGKVNYPLIHDSYIYMSKIKALRVTVLILIHKCYYINS